MPWGCQGFLCPKACKNDSKRICLDSAIQQDGAQLLDECRVVRLEADHDTVTHVICVRRGEEFRLLGTNVVLAAGALETPALLLRSASSDWPDGLANASGLVGRNLMRHDIDLYAVFLKAKDGLGGGQEGTGFQRRVSFELGQGRHGPSIRCPASCPDPGGRHGAGPAPTDPLPGLFRSSNWPNLS